MKSARRNSLPFFALLAMGVALTGPLSAQTNEPPARLGIIAEPEAGVAADLLTVEFTTKPQLQVLEREQVAKMYPDRLSTLQS